MGRPYALAALLWGAVMFIGSTAAVVPSAFWLFPQEDKLLHFLEFALLALLIYKALLHSSRINVARRAAGGAFMIGILYGAALEGYQAILPARSCDFIDFLADCAGIAAGVCLFRERR